MTDCEINPLKDNGYYRNRFDNILNIITQNITSCSRTLNIAYYLNNRKKVSHLFGYYELLRFEQNRFLVHQICGKLYDPGIINKKICS